MIAATDLLEKLPGRAHALAVTYYIAAIVGLALATWLSLGSLADRYAAYSSSVDLLARMESRRAATAPGDDGGPVVMESAPFLEAATLTIAGADLQKRVTALVHEAGGNVLSSQVDLQQPEGSTDHVGLTISAEIDQAEVQKLLYEIEAGMPFLFIDRLQLQPVQQQGGTASGPRLRIQATISGQWQQATP
jgi:general secretion pathway protein M